MQLAGINDRDIIFIQQIGNETDSCLVSVTEAEQYFHIRMPVDGIEITVVNLVWNIDLGPAVKDKILIVTADVFQIVRINCAYFAELYCFPTG